MGLEHAGCGLLEPEDPVVTVTRQRDVHVAVAVTVAEHTGGGLEGHAFGGS